MVPEVDGPEAVKRATEACLRLLAVRARSQHELRQALARKGYTERVCDEVLENLKGYGYVDDARFARDRAASLLSKGRLGPSGVLQRLQAHGLDGDAASAALTEASGAVEFDALATARQALEKKGLLGRPLNPKERARAARFLHGRGFSEEVIHRLLGEASLDPSGSDD